ncbi:hypothetical protein RirG_094700 [Rhizophagus irregularis DAOM 197198w]|uniref:MULE transposase domain-containing protein n=1 Tax=Rhizophagus irregularis (strain DAOM 197198w) TaxID=1432141 RepID=A0A015KPU2_RHIIW|nr:hypothetical protein RirG_094700 [Rhizophagus irregularis DAOM 197198w]
MSDLKIINISSDSSESEDQEFSLPQELAYNEERLEKTLALINTIYHITDIRHSLFPIEYPDSSNDGIAYVFHVENWADKKAVFGDIQYSLGKPSGAHSNTFCPYLGVKCKDEKKTCQGLKLCSIAASDLIINTTHTIVDPDVDLLSRNPSFFTLSSLHQIQLNTQEEYLAAIKTKCCYNNYTCNGKPVVRYHKANRSDANQYFIGCSLYTFGTRHRYISGKPNIDEDLLKELFRNEGRISTIEDDKKCFTTIPSASRKKECPIPHVKDGKIELLPLVKIGCNVIFHKYEPLDLKSCPYIVMVVKNTHSHPLPPPHRIPGHLQENVKNLIKNSNDLLSDTTSRKLISGPLIKAVFGEVVLSDIHASMNNIDKLRNIVMKEQKLLHPHGQGIMGVVHAFNQNEANLRDYIQRIIFTDSGNVIILCMIKLQAIHMSKFKYFMVDMSYKRVFGEMNEFEFNAYDEDNHSIVTFCRIFTNGSDSKIYQCMFTTFFEVYEDLTGEKPSFYHFNSEKKGWAAIIVDLDKGQAKGLSLALNSLCNSISAEQHLLYILKSCSVHFERNVRNSKYSDESKFLMRQLLKAKTKDDVDFIFEQLETIGDEKIHDWITEYQTPWILASLNHNYSLMDYDIWMTTPFDTNVSECSHANVNREGTRLRLKTAIFHSWNYDLTLYRRFHNYQKYNIPMSSKNKSGTKRKIDANKRKEKRKNIQIQKLPNKRQKVSVKENDSEFQKRIQELEYEERKEELERKRLDNQLKKLEIAQKEKELKELNE